MRAPWLDAPAVFTALRLAAAQGSGQFAVRAATHAGAEAEREAEAGPAPV